MATETNGEDKLFVLAKYAIAPHRFYGPGEGGDGEGEGAGGDGSGEGAGEGAGEGSGEGQGTPPKTEGKKKAPTKDAPEPYSFTRAIENISDADLREFLKRSDSLESFGRYALGLRQKVSNAIVPLGEDATEEEIADYRSKIGVPAKADEYDIERNQDVVALEGEKGMEASQAFIDAMHAAGATNEVVNAAFQYYDQVQIQAREAQQEAANREMVETEADLKREYGEDYEARMAAVNAAVKHLGVGEVLEEHGLLNNKKIIQTFSKIAAEMQITEHGMMGSPTESGLADLKTQHAELTTQIREARDNGDHTKADQLVRKRAEVSRAMGSEPLVGQNNRTV